MKICILTFRLHSNFGFLMQAYALQYVLKSLGHDPYTVDIRVEPFSLSSKIKNIIKLLLLFISRKLGFPQLPYITSKEQAYIDKNTWEFIHNNINLTSRVKSIKDLTKIGNQYDFYLVGSDQVWRKEYCPHIPSYFLGFVSKGRKKASYAASFGVSNPNYTNKMIKQCKKLLSEFSAISVREAEGVKICRDLFGVEATQTLDPTLLLDKSKYLELVNTSEKTQHPETPFILAYILDESSEKLSFIKQYAKKKQLAVYYIKPQNINEVGIKRIDECVYPSISQWLNAFENADFIITDSFHGTVFSIIFKKQFVVIDNPKRGSSRLISLLKSFSLEDRLITNNKKINVISLIDYDKVEPILKEKKIKSLSFLEYALKGDANTY